MLVSSHDEIAPRCYGTFENPIVRFISQDMDAGFRSCYGCNLRDTFQSGGNLILVPPKFLSQLLRRFGENSKRSEKAEIPLQCMEIGFLRLFARDHEGRDEDIGIKNNPQAHRPSNTILSTSFSVKIPFPRASLLP